MSEWLHRWVDRWMGEYMDGCDEGWMGERASCKISPKILRRPMHKSEIHTN